MSHPDDPRVLAPGHAPTPFTASEIRAASPPGRTMRISVEAAGASYIRTIRFVAVDEDGAERESHAITGDGVPLGEPTIERTTWREFQQHASFPEATTTIDVEALTTPLGRLECRVYTVRDAGAVTRYWFAVDRPGMPVRVETTEGDEVTRIMTMIEDKIT